MRRAIVTSTMMNIIFTTLTAALAVSIEPWFDDPDTARHLGGREWVHTALHLMKVMPGYTDGDTTVLDRRAWVVKARSSLARNGRRTRRRAAEIAWQRPR